MRAYAVLLALLAAALFGAAAPASKVLLDDFPPFQLAGLLYLGAAIGIAPIAWRQGGWRSLAQLSWLNRWRLGGAIACGGILGPVFLLWGLNLASATNVSLWLNLELVATAVLGCLLFRDYLGKWGWMGVIGTVLAAAMLSWGEGVAGWQAGALVGLACLCWGFDNHLTALLDGIPPTQSTFWKGLVAGTVNLAIGVALQPFAASPFMSAVGLGVGALSYGASITLYITAAQSLGATRAQVVFACAPFFGVLFSGVALGEKISTLQWVALLVKVAALFLLLLDRHSHAHEHEPISHEHLHRHDDGHHGHTHPELPELPIHAQHSHWHAHSAIVHAHPHVPDIHHRHRHASNVREEH